MAFHETKKFKQLQTEWYNRLKESGFKDIEKNETTILYRRKYSCNINKYEYYEAIANCVYHSSFDKPIDFLVMLGRSEGKKTDEMCRDFKKIGLKPHNKESIRYIIRKYEIRWGIRKHDGPISYNERINGKNREDQNNH